MNENKVLDDILYMNNAWMHFENEVLARRFELVDSWIDGASGDLSLLRKRQREALCGNRGFSG